MDKKKPVDHKALWERLKSELRTEAQELRKRVDAGKSTPLGRGMCIMAEAVETMMYKLEHGDGTATVLSPDQLH